MYIPTCRQYAAGAARDLIAAFTVDAAADRAATIGAHASRPRRSVISRGTRGMESGRAQATGWTISAGIARGEMKVEWMSRGCGFLRGDAVSGCKSGRWF